MERSCRQWLCELIERKSGSEEKHVFRGVDEGKARKRKERTNDRTGCGRLNINVVLMWIRNLALGESPWIINCMLYKPKKELLRFLFCFFVLFFLPFIKTLREIDKTHFIQNSLITFSFLFLEIQTPFVIFYFLSLSLMSIGSTLQDVIQSF